MLKKNVILTWALALALAKNIFHVSCESDPLQRSQVINSSCVVIGLSHHHHHQLIISCFFNNINDFKICFWLFFFFKCALGTHVDSAFLRFVEKWWISCTVYGIRKYRIKKKKKTLKTGSHDTIHTFKNYFTTMFSIFSNKRYPIKPLIWQ